MTFTISRHHSTSETQSKKKNKQFKMGGCLSKESEGQVLGTSNSEKKQQQQQTTTIKPSQTKPQSRTQTQGRVLSTEQPKSATTNQLSPREAARLAAEERAQAFKNQGGKLSEQLHKERSKSTQQHLKELSEKKALENQKPIYE
ncbi:hypothetical protein WICPIJ_009721 [Wickerhamomyces pijperi]|uniref:Uncharacterized protein n=1 Tax=Wickerhamomyces pijperi TaxID=599730 RepID=A0A9P8PLT3_WICPI|nr:hypothetical protein WICPIJ_009721 [Wickerhamomyces pijperi]